MKKFLLINILLLSLVACAGNLIVPTDAVVMPTLTPWVDETQTALADSTPTPPPFLPSPTFTPWVEGTMTAVAATNQAGALPTFPSPTLDPQAIVAKPTDFTPVLYGKKFDTDTFFLLLGGASMDAWLTPEVSAMRFSGETTYSLHTLHQQYKYFFWGKSPDFTPTCQSFTIRTDIDVNEPGMVATLDGWIITKRAVAELSADSEFYRQVVIDWLAGKGVNAPQVGSMHIFRVDLEGDGVDEIFISAAHLDDSQHTTKAGDYAVVLMRKVVGNEVVTVPLVADTYSSKDLEITYPRTYSLANFIDLNQDGALEVIVDIQGWEKVGAIVFQVNGQNIVEALWTEC